MENIIIRQAKEQDFRDIAQLAEKCSPMATERNSIYHIFTHFFQNTVFVAEVEVTRYDNDSQTDSQKGLIGFLLGFKSQRDTEESYIHLLCIDPNYRGRGIALKLIKKFLKVVGNMGTNKILLITKPINKKAIKFYEKLGFQKNVGYETIKVNGIDAVKDYNGKGEHMVVFQKIISKDDFID